jgi:polar amino acid transport system permease protein
MNIVETFLNISVARESAPLLLKGLMLTVALGLSSVFAAFIIGSVVAILRLYSPWPFRWLTIIYIDVFRAFPMLVLLIIVYYALPFIGIRLSGFMAATTALSLIAAAYAAETIRAGLEAVPRGQFEAAHALGMPWWRMMIDVIAPQATRLVIPPATGIGVSLIKDTALASIVAMPDLLKQATQAQAFYANPTPLMLAAALYLIILLPLVQLVAHLERRSSSPR